MPPDDAARMPWSIRLVLIWSFGVIVLGVAVAVVDSPDTPGPDSEVARTWGRLIGRRVILSLAPLAVVGLVLARFRWIANSVLTAHAAVMIASTPKISLEAAFSCAAWLLLLSPSAQRFLARTPGDSVSTSPPLSRRASIRIVATAALSGLLPGSGQLLNRTYRRAGVQLTVWAAGWITHLQPVWVLVCLYSMCEAGWTAAELARPRRDALTNPTCDDAATGTSSTEKAD